MLDANAVRAGDEYFSTGDECSENAHSSVSHTHTAGLAYVRLQLSTRDFQAEFMSR